MYGLFESDLKVIYLSLFGIGFVYSSEIRIVTYSNCILKLVTFINVILYPIDSWLSGNHTTVTSSYL